jgi:hypothetical protein
MIVTLDGQRLEQPLAAEQNLGSLLEHVRTHAGERLLVSVSLDGRVLNDVELQASMSRPVPHSAQLDVESSEPIALVVSVLRGLAASFEDAGAELPAIADGLGATENSAAIRRISGIISLWQTSYRALAQCSGILQRDLTELATDERAVRDHLVELIAQLSELRRVLEARDVVALTDMVRYELPALAERWQRLAADLAEQVEAGASA